MQILDKVGGIVKKVIIIGAGPSALFAAKAILENSSAIFVEVIDRGKTPSKRFCAADFYQCQHCVSCDTLEGVGGAGLFSDGKLILDLTSGGKADGVSALTYDERYSLEEYIKETFVNFDGVSEVKSKPSKEVQNKLKSTFRSKNLEFKLYSVLHMGTQNLKNITTNFIDYLMRSFGERFKIEDGTNVSNIEKNDSGYSIIANTQIIHADAVVAAVGKSGARWLKENLSVLGCSFTSHDFFFGFRMETRKEAVRSLAEYSFDPKIFRIDSGRKVKIHCFCRNGNIRYSRYRNTIVVCGHSPYTKGNNIRELNEKKANFNLLLSFDKKLISPDDLLSKFRLVNEDALLVQKLSDYMSGQDSKEFGAIVPDNLSMVKLGNIRSLMESVDAEFSRIVVKFLCSLAEFCPDIMDGDNLLYAPAIEWDMDTVTVNSHMETELDNLFAIGDGAGLSQGIVYSAATGIIAAREIVARFEDKRI